MLEMVISIKAEPQPLRRLLTTHKQYNLRSRDCQFIIFIIMNISWLKIYHRQSLVTDPIFGATGGSIIHRQQKFT